MEAAGGRVHPGQWHFHSRVCGFAPCRLRRVEGRAKTVAWCLSGFDVVGLV